MNIFKNALKLTLGIALLFLFSCEKDENDSNTKTLTNEIGKVETIYQEGAVKLENKLSPDSSKIETSADESYKAKIRQELESFSKQTTYLKSGGGQVGILKNGSCGTYQELTILLDCEDGNWITSGTGYIGSNNIDLINGNVTLSCCVVPSSFSRCQYDYAVLDITGNPLPSGVNGFTRYIDNEDSNNKNKVTLGGNTITAMGACTFNANTTLAFLFYPKITGAVGFGSAYGALYLHYFGVFGTPIPGLPTTTQIDSFGTIMSDDEDYRNGNWLSQTINVPLTDCTTNIMKPGINTTFNLLWIYLPSW